MILEVSHSQYTCVYAITITQSKQILYIIYMLICTNPGMSDLYLVITSKFLVESPLILYR